MRLRCAAARACSAPVPSTSTERAAALVAPSVPCCLRYRVPCRAAGALRGRRACPCAAALHPLALPRRLHHALSPAAGAELVPAEGCLAVHTTPHVSCAGPEALARAPCALCWCWLAPPPDTAAGSGARVARRCISPARPAEAGGAAQSNSAAGGSRRRGCSRCWHTTSYSPATALRCWLRLLCNTLEARSQSALHPGSKGVTSVRCLLRETTAGRGEAQEARQLASRAAFRAAERGIYERAEARVPWPADKPADRQYVLAAAIEASIALASAATPSAQLHLRRESGSV